jgi:hypothetical protein
MLGHDMCAQCGAALHGLATCSACGTTVSSMDADQDVTATITRGLPSSSLSPSSSPPPFPRGRVALLALNLALLVVATTMTAWNVFDPPPSKSHSVPRLVPPTTTSTDVATDAPVYTVSGTTPHPTSTSAGQGAPSSPTATSQAQPKATATPPPPPPTATTPPPTPTFTVGTGG